MYLRASAAPSEHDGMLCRLYSVLHRVDSAAVAWAARFERDGDQGTAAFLQKWIKVLSRRFLDNELPRPLRFLALATLADMSLISRNISAEGHQRIQVHQ